MLNQLSPRVLLTAGLALPMIVSSGDLTAAAIVASDDTYVQITDFSAGTPPIRDAADPKLSLQDHNGDATQDRLSIIRFDNVNDFGTSSGSSLSVTVSGGSFTAVSTTETWFFELYGVTETQEGNPANPTEEDNMDESTYSAALAEAVDVSGNRINENFIFDGDALAGGDQPIATVTTTGQPSVNDVLTFSGDAFDSFLSTVTTDGLDDDVAFVLRLRTTDTNGRIRTDLYSRDTGEGDQRPILNVVVPEPASVALVAAGSFMLLGRRRRHA